MLLVAGCLLTGCAEYATYTPSAADLTLIAVEYQGEDKPMIQGTAVARYLTAEAAVVVREQAAAQIVQLEATKAAAVDAERRQYLAMTADAQATRDVLSAEGTRQAVAIEATRQAMQMRATATAEVVQVTAVAMAIEATRAADERYWAATLTAEGLSRDATATAQARADLATATQQARNDRMMATAEAVRATEGAVHATMTRQAQRREMVLGVGRDYGIPLVAFGLCGLAVVVVVVWWLEYRKKPVIYPRSFLGDAEPMGFPRKDGGMTLVDIDLQPGPVIAVLPDGRIEAPMLRDKGQEERTKARDQAVDAMTRPKLGGGAGRAGLGMPAPPESAAPGLRSVRMVRELGQAQRVGVLSGPLAESLEADWEEYDGYDQ